MRLILFAASVGILVFALLVRGHMERSHLLPILSIAGFLIFNGIWVAIVPVLAGTSMHWALREPLAFVVLSLVVLVLALLQPGQLAWLVPRLQRARGGNFLDPGDLPGRPVGAGDRAGRPDMGGALRLGRSLPGGRRPVLSSGQLPDGFFRVFWISTLSVRSQLLLGAARVPVIPAKLADPGDCYSSTSSCRTRGGSGLGCWSARRWCWLRRRARPKSQGCRSAPRWWAQLPPQLSSGSWRPPER